MTTYIYLSDIHANFEALRQLKNLPEYDDPSVQFRFGGDYSDGFNLQPNATINTWRFIKELCDAGKAQAIIGNHDDFIIRAYKRQPNPYWHLNGQATTIQNLNLPLDVLEDSYFLREALIQYYADEMEWLTKLPYTIQDGKNILVHAGFDLDIPFSLQDPNCMLWARRPYIEFERFININDVRKSFKDKTIISGHTPTVNISNDENCPIVHDYNAELNLHRYFIDGGSKGGPKHNGRINLLHLDHEGQLIWMKYMDQDGIHDAE